MTTRAIAQVHDTETCNCEHCLWANKVEQAATSRHDHLQQLRATLIDEIARLYGELGRVDGEIEALELEGQ